MASLPQGFPAKMEGPMAWDGPDYEDQPDLYTNVLSKDDLAEIHEAISHFKATGLSRGHINQQTFPLSERFSKRLNEVNSILNDGKGFHVIRGIDPNQFTEEEHVLLFAGMASHIADNRKAWIDHICNNKVVGPDEPPLRPTELAVPMDFHTDADAGNILALFTENKGKAGGYQYLSSFWSVYNTIMEEDPSVMACLAADWHWEKPDRGQEGRVNQVMDRRAIVGHVNGKPEINYGRTFVAGSAEYPLSADAPRLTVDQIHALDVLSTHAKRHAFRVHVESGDILLVNNLSILHARTAFEDSPAENLVRHVLRLWLKDNTSWPVASSLKYLENSMWATTPEQMNILTLTEWNGTPRTERLTETGTSCSHD
ncbi:hypothetical protein F5Y16DRAFT_370578 [Xylariaceae sp. FL0255]|nr:hypothetical protein F5Y16DRAFT_370578 [Xylariaceae sp. FL0255]